MPTNEVEHEEVIAMDREMWILRQLETSLTASADALAERLQVSPRTVTNLSLIHI